MPYSDHAVLLKATAEHGRRETAVLCCGHEKNGVVGAWHGKASENQTRPHCVNQMGKTHSKRLAARHGRGTAWARHAMCESAFTVLMTNTAPIVSISHVRYWILCKHLYTVLLLDAFAKHCVTRLFALYNLSSACLYTHATIRLPLDGFFLGGILCYAFLQKLYVTDGFRWNRYNRAKLKRHLKTCVHLCQYVAVHEVIARNTAESERPKKHDDLNIILCHTDAV